VKLMKCLFFLPTAIWAGTVCASPEKQVVESCLTIEAVAPSIRYIDLRPINYNLEEDSGVTSMTFIDRGRQIGTWESPQSKDFGVVYNGRKMRQRDVIKLGPDQPTTFDPTLAQWGIVTMAKRQYVCATFNFDGLGRSGSFQNIRGVYIIDMKSRPVKIYYIVRDARKVSS
jgi:hypothetical protein